MYDNQSDAFPMNLPHVDAGVHESCMHAFPQKRASSEPSNCTLLISIALCRHTLYQSASQVLILVLCAMVNCFISIMSLTLVESSESTGQKLNVADCTGTFWH